MDSHRHQHEQKEHKKKPDLKIIEGGLLPQSHTENQIGDALNVQVYKDPKNLVRFFQLIGQSTMRFALFSSKRCIDIYKAAVMIQKKQ